MLDALATRFNPPFPLEAPRVFWMMNNPYADTDGMIKDLQRNPRFAKLAVAIVDLRGELGDLTERVGSLLMGGMCTTSGSLPAW